jgi:DNA segregation ATPase FtsK/SpoIIIE-like protein
MFKLDNNFLIELGLGALPAEEKNKMLSHIYETLEMRVGMKLAEQMTDAQLDEFESYINRNDEAGALGWLEGNFPDYKLVVSAELEKLKNEIKAVAPSIIAESMSNVNNTIASTPQQAQPQPQQFQQPQPQYQQPPQQYQQPQQPPQPQYRQPPLPPQYPPVS